MTRPPFIHNFLSAIQSLAPAIGVVRSRVSATQYQRLCQVALLTVLLLAGASLSGCSRRYHDMPVYLPTAFKDYENHSVGRFKTSYLAEQIDTYYRGSNPGPIGVTTFVNVDDLYTTSTFGRMVAEQVMSELAMKGYDVIELRHSDALQFLNPAGEFALSRDLRAVRPVRDLGGIVVGTYVVSPVRVYVNARLVDPTSSLILSAGSVEMSKTTELARMLRGGSVPATLERIPVRHLGHSTYPLSLFPQYGRDFEEEFGSRDSFAVQPQLRQAPPAKRPAAPPQENRR